MTADRSEDIRRLRAAVGDLLALSIVPQVWVGREPSAIAVELADVLVESFGLDFAFVRLCDPAGGESVEAMRGDAWKAFPEWLQRRAATSGRISQKEIVTRAAGLKESSCGLVIPVGVHAECGLVAVACSRADCPDQIDQQLLSVAANIAATAFQNARLIRELRSAHETLRAREQELSRARDELAITVEERTSELRRSEREFRDARVKLNRASRIATVAELSASIAHELNQPLAAVYANAQAARRWLSANPPNLPETTSSIVRIMRDVRAADDVVQHVRALFKRESFDKQDVDLPDMLSEAVRFVREDPRKRDVAVDWRFDEDLPAVSADRTQIQQVFINLISNAIEAMEGSQVVPRVMVRASAANHNQMLIQVIDNGPGVGDPERIFDAFVTTKENGMGIGLAISRSIIEVHGGRLWAENHLEGGAIFTVALPLG
jgi:C4-dicarboxylate-specific signal transduction histidine kinase